MLPLLLFPAAALAATLALPAGESSSSWAGPARLAGLSLAGPADPADVVCVAGPRGWTIRVEGVDGTIRREVVPIPSDARGREDLVWLASSLLQDVEAKAGEVRPVLRSAAAVEVAAVRAPPAPRAAPVPQVPVPVEKFPPPAVPRPTHARPAPEPPPLPVPVPIAVAVAEPISVVVAEPIAGLPAIAEPAADPPPPVGPSLRPWLATDLAYALRAGLSPALHLSVHGGLQLGETWALGLQFALPYQREVNNTEGTLRTLDLLAATSWAPAWRLAPQLGAGVGATYGTWEESGEMLHHRLLPLADLGAGLALRLHPALRLGVSVGLRAELAPTTLQVGSEAPYALTPWQEELQLSLRGQIP